MCVEFPSNGGVSPGDVLIADDGKAYVAIDENERERCEACDVGSKEECRFKSLCSAFYRKDAKSLAFKRVGNLEDVLSHLLLHGATPPREEGRSKPAVERYSSGAVREVSGSKPRFDLISPLMELRLAKRLAEGTKKYAERNWEKGIPASRSLAAALRHLNAYRRGDEDEDHLTAALCNLMFLIHLEESCARGLTSSEFLDLPRYKPQTKGTE